MSARQGAVHSTQPGDWRRAAESRSIASAGGGSDLRTHGRAVKNPARASILAFAAITSCRHLTDPPLPMNAEPFAPHPVYARWWSMVESCSGLKGSLDAVQWYAAPGPLRNPDNGAEPINGYWSLASNRIVLDLNNTIDGQVVRHEMLHALVHTVGHPRSAFLLNCGGVVSCGEQCVRDAGPAVTPDASIARVTPVELEVTSEVAPAPPSSTIDGGLATFTISVRNPLSFPVFVSLPKRAGGGLARSYHYDIQRSDGSGLSSGDLALDPGVRFFKAGETKRAVVDFLVTATPSPSFGAIAGLGENGIALPPGSYSFRGDFGGKSAPDLSVVLGQ